MDKIVSFTVDGEIYAPLDDSLDPTGIDSIMGQLEEKGVKNCNSVRRIQPFVYVTNETSSPFGCYWASKVCRMVLEDMGLSKAEVIAAMDESED